MLIPLSLTAQLHSELVINLGDRRYRIRGLSKNMSYDQLKVNVLISRGDLLHVDMLDIYSARHRASYIKQAGIELGYKGRTVFEFERSPSCWPREEVYSVQKAENFSREYEA